MRRKKEIIFLFITVIAIIVIGVTVYETSMENRTLVLLNESLKSQMDIIEENNAELEKKVETLKSELDTYNNAEISDDKPPQITSIKVNDLDGNNITDNGWVIVPENGKIKFEFKIEGPCTQLDLFYTPTGTETYIMQKMIDSINVSSGEESVTYIWEVPKGTMCHFWVLTYNVNIASVSEIVNIYYD